MGTGYGLSIVTPAAASALELAKVRTDHLRVSITDDDAYIQTLIEAATRHVEQHIEWSLIETTWRLRLDRFPCGRGPIKLPVMNAKTVTEIAYVAIDGTTATLDAAKWKFSSDRTPPLIRLAVNAYWPAASCEPDAVSVTFKAGVAKTEDVPADIGQALLLLVGHWYEHREEVLTGTVSKSIERAVDSLLAPYAYDADLEEFDL